MAGTSAQHLLSYLQSLDDETLGARIGRGRSVIEQFAHLHDARVMWLEALVPGATPTVTKLGRRAHSSERVAQALDASAAAIAVLLDRHERSGSDVPAFRNRAAAFLAYLVAHDAHHRGYVAAILKQRGSPVPRAISYGIWEWSRSRTASSPRDRARYRAR